jgi:hypothetical protein
MDEKQLSILVLQTEIKEVNAQVARGKHKNKRKFKQSGSSEWGWNKVLPRPGEPKTNRFKGKTYDRCNNHTLWCLHKPSECKLKGEDTKKKRRRNKEELKMKVYQSLFESTSKEDDEH